LNIKSKPFSYQLDDKVVNHQTSTFVYLILQNRRTRY